jgi:hypothetical protein
MAELLCFAMRLLRMIVKIPAKETSFTNEANANHFNENQIMHCIDTYATGMY